MLVKPCRYCAARRDSALANHKPLLCLFYGHCTQEKRQGACSLLYSTARTVACLPIVKDWH
jgi:hypothetical protein